VKTALCVACIKVFAVSVAQRFDSGVLARQMQQARDLANVVT
jgi:hypothetical protein